MKVVKKLNIAAFVANLFPHSMFCSNLQKDKFGAHICFPRQFSVNHRAWGYFQPNGNSLGVLSVKRLSDMQMYNGNCIMEYAKLMKKN